MAVPTKRISEKNNYLKIYGLKIYKTFENTCPELTF